MLCSRLHSGCSLSVTMRCISIFEDCSGSRLPHQHFICSFAVDDMSEAPMLQPLQPLSCIIRSSEGQPCQKDLKDCLEKLQEHAHVLPPSPEQALNNVSKVQEQASLPRCLNTLAEDSSSVTSVHGHQVYCLLGAWPLSCKSVSSNKLES